MGSSSRASQGWGSSGGCAAAQRAAMASRVAIHTRGRERTCWMKRSKYRMRPGRPMIRRCTPSDIMRGAAAPSA